MMPMDQGARGWLTNTAKRHYWRVAAWYEFDDLINDGLMCWVHVCRKYPKVKNRSHLMRLFQMCYLNQITFIAKRQRATKLEVAVDTFEFIPSVAYQSIDADISSLIKEGPTCLQRLLELMSKDVSRKRLFSLRRFRDGRLESKNEQLCRLLGLDPEQTDVVREIRQYLSPKEVAA